MIVNDQDKKQDSTDKIYKFSDVVKFEFKYPADFKKPKYHKDGDVVDMHVVQAEDFVARKLGKIVGK